MPLTSLAINAHRAKYLVATFDGLEVSRRNGFSSCQNPLRSFPLIKNNDCSLEMRSHSWRRRNGIGTGIIIISLLSTFFFPFFFFSFPSFFPPLPRITAPTGGGARLQMLKDKPVTFRIFIYRIYTIYTIRGREMIETKARKR